MRSFAVALIVLVSCREPPPPPFAPAPAPRAATAVPSPEPEDRSDVELPIPARAQAPESPPSGWCGETAIQEGLLHLGAWAPQSFINRAGRPTHPDLYSPEIPIALRALGVRFERYPARARGYDAFAAWARASIDEGDPVLAGVKILPTAHPEWGLDHFVLVVGYGKKGLLVNTTWGHRAWIASGVTKGLSLDGAFYGLRLRTLSLPANAKQARVEMIEDDAAPPKVRATCDADRRLERVVDGRVDEPDGPAIEIDPSRPVTFRCVPR